jgi:hypothetical protein
MTNSQRHLIKLTARNGNIELCVHLCILANLETGSKCGFFVDNAESDAICAGLTTHQFAGALGSLANKGFYEASQDPEYKGSYGYYTK